MRGTVDDSLAERRGIEQELARVAAAELTAAELEEVAQRLHPVGRRAVPPLLRRLWREQRGELLARYAYLLDLLAEDGGIDELVQIVLRRRDLSAEGSAALLAALQQGGVDTTASPFARLHRSLPATPQGRLLAQLEQGEEGLLGFLDDFLLAGNESRLARIRELATVTEHAALPAWLEVLLRGDDPDVLAATFELVGRIRRPWAARLLQELLPELPLEQRPRGERSLRRLAFLGQVHQPAAPREFREFYAAAITPFDGGGHRALHLTRWLDDGRLGTLWLLLHERCGVVDGAFYPALEQGETDTLLADFDREEAYVAVSPRYLLAVVRDGLLRQREEGLPEIPDFFRARPFFRRTELEPASYQPALEGYDLAALTVGPATAASADLLDDPYLEGWLLAERRVYDLAEQWLADAPPGGDDGGTASRLEELVTCFAEELVAPRRQRLVRRLVLTADFMVQTGRQPEEVTRLLAVAAGLADWRLPLGRHPLVRRLALESLELAREALTEGHDLRREVAVDEDVWD